MALTFDTGALIALESRRQRISKVVEVARRDLQQILVPANVVAEWWRGSRNQIEILSGLTVVDVTASVARAAGDALAGLRIGGGRRVDASMTIDATVIATAALLGPNLYTGDHEDMAQFTSHFPTVRLFAVTGR